MRADSDKASTTPKPRRRWFQFSLRTLLVLFTALAIWAGFKANRAHNQRIAADAIRSVEGEVCYDDQLSTPANFDVDLPPRGPAWLRECIGEHWFHDIVFVDLRGPRVSDALLAQLKSVTSIRWLTLRGTEITDEGFLGIRSLHNLQYLDLDGTAVSDTGLQALVTLKKLRILSLRATGATGVGLQHLESLTQLAELDLSNTCVADDDLAHLKNLPNLRRLLLRYCQITDAGLRHLKSHSALDEVDLWYTQVTRQGVATLQAELPNVELPYKGTDQSSGN